eukprot:TRINITY_DN105642_c0_g1_i1.p1 TRINITY_DN105642_c0_g1~~TRINITY_DN105642_c0_g1_i1.p1  ORF type:complete len:1008 (-),score=182.54 TRINITY_DN105642_c0_g1_i1:80-3079(-)
MAVAFQVGTIKFWGGVLCGVLGLLVCLQLVTPSRDEIAADQGARRLLSRRQLMTAAQQKAEAKKLSKLALASADEVFAKVVVPEMNKIIPLQIQKVGDDPMAQVVKSKTMTVTNLVGLQYASIQTITASKLQGNTEFETGLAETVTATMELEGTVTQPMTANGVLQVGKDDTGKDEKTDEDMKDGRQLAHRLRKEDSRLLAPRQLKDGIEMAKDGAKMTSNSLKGASGSYQMSFTNVKLKMPMTGTIQISTGVDLTNPDAIMSNLAHLTIQSIANGNPSVSMDIKLECNSAMDMDCHTANAAIGAAKPLIDMEIGDHAKTIVQNIINKVLPMTLGDKTSKPASGTIKGHMKLSAAAASTRRLQQPGGLSSPGTCDAGSVPCGGKCLAGKTTDICCLDPSGAGIVCGQDARCENGVCLAPNGVHGSCRLDEIACGGHCLAGKATDKCCLGPSGAGIVCGQYARCDNGVCLADDGVGESCPSGMIKCGVACLVGTANDVCCVGPSGAGIVCGAGARCDKGLCLAGDEVGELCPPDQIKCGDHCLAGKPTDTCCLDSSGAGIVCGQYARCEKGLCLAPNGVNGLCRPDEIKCGDHCLAAKPTDKCCLGPSGAGIVCGQYARCNNGVCLADNGVGEECPPGEIKCGDHCIAGKPTDTCCVGSLGGAIVCGADARCDNGVCLANTGAASSSEQDVSPSHSKAAVAVTTRYGTTQETQLSHAIAKTLADVVGVPPETVSVNVSSMSESSTADPVSVTYDITVPPESRKDVFEATYKLLRKDDDDMSKLIGNHLQGISSDQRNFTVIDSDAKVLNPMLVPEAEEGGITSRGINEETYTNKGQFPWWIVILAAILILSLIAWYCMRIRKSRKRRPANTSDSSDEDETEALTSSRTGAPFRQLARSQAEAASAKLQQHELPPTMQLSQVMQEQSQWRSQFQQPQTTQMQLDSAQHRMMRTQQMQAPAYAFGAGMPQSSLAQGTEFCKECGKRSLQPGDLVCPQCGTPQ